MSRHVNTTSPKVRRGRIFATRLNEALDGTTSEAFARSIDRTLRTVQRWRAGESEPRGADLVLVARALERDPAWFYGEPSPDLPEAA